MTKILAAVDFSEAGMPAVRTAVDLAKRLGGSVTLLHVYHPWSDYFDPPGFREKMRPTLLTRLKELVEQVRDPEVEIHTALEEGRPSSVIEHFARRWHYDLIVVGSGGHGWAARPMLGTIAERVLRSTTVPVLVVPHAQGQSSEPGKHESETG